MAKTTFQIAPIDRRNDVASVTIEVLEGVNSEALTTSARENAQRIFVQLYEVTDLNTFSALLQSFRDFDRGELDPMALQQKFNGNFIRE